jgi:DNA-binding GntR family transcriptional regulator
MEKTAHKTLSGFVFTTLRERILSGQYEAGMRLDQAALAQELDVSLIPLRETLRQLEAEGLVKIYPHRGAFVAERSSDEVLEISRIRAVLEELATQQAVKCLSKHALHQLSDLMKAMQRAIADQNMSLLLNLNEQFHFTLYQACHQPLLLQLIRGLWDRNRLYRQRTVYSATQAKQSHAEHKAILDACVAGDAQAAGSLMRKHIARVTENILSKIDKDGTKNELDRSRNFTWESTRRQT